MRGGELERKEEEKERLPSHNLRHNMRVCYGKYQK